jgi:hypothetical protein
VKEASLASMREAFCCFQLRGESSGDEKGSMKRSFYQDIKNIVKSERG